MLIETASNPVYQEVLGHTQKRKEVWKAGTAPGASRSPASLRSLRRKDEKQKNLHPIGQAILPIRYLGSI
ncbi:MAG: hypothetical protein PVJ54_14870 [Desulfobacterales bacterium]